MDLSPLLGEVKLKAELEAPVVPWSRDCPGQEREAVPRQLLFPPCPSHSSCVCPRMAAEQGQVETLSQVLNILCCCLIDFKLCLLGNAPQDGLHNIGRVCS